MTDKAKARHELKQTNDHPEGGLAGTCSCGRWGYAGAASMRKLREFHRQHIQEVGGGRR